MTWIIWFNISDYYMHELACIATQYIPIRVRCIGMYCGMYCGMYWWYVLNTYQHVFNTNRYVFNTYLSVLVCIVLVLGTYWIVIPANTDSIHTTIHTIIHAKYIVHVLVCIALRANICQHVLACIVLVFGMYEIMIRANTDQIHAFVFQYVPIRTQIHSPIRAQYNQIQTYTSSNTDQCKHHRPMHTSSFSILAF